MQTQREPIRKIDKEESGLGYNYNIYIVGPNKQKMRSTYNISIEVEDGENVRTIIPLCRKESDGSLSRIRADMVRNENELKQRINDPSIQHLVVLNNEGKVYSDLFKIMGLEYVHKTNVPNGLV